jgi:hypothetical protein
MDVLSTNGFSGIGKTAVCLAQEMSQARFRCADRNKNQASRFALDEPLRTRNARESQAFPCDSVPGSRYEPRANDDC